MGTAQTIVQSWHRDLNDFGIGLINMTHMIHLMINKVMQSHVTRSYLRRGDITCSIWDAYTASGYVSVLPSAVQNRHKTIRVML